MIVELAWPPRVLSPNARGHWLKKNAPRAKYQSDAYLLAMAAGGRSGAGTSVAITFNPPDNRRRDLDNMLSSIKAGLDGISRAIGVDDSKWSLTIAKGEPVKGGKVVIEVSE